MGSLSKYVLSETFDKEFNAFRQTGVLEVIPDADIYGLSRYFDGDVGRTVEELIYLGVKCGNDYFSDNGSYIEFREDTLSVLQSKRCPDEVLEVIRREKNERHKDINAAYDSIKDSQEKVLLYFLDKSNALFSNDSYSDICENIQENNKYWKRNDPIAVEMLIRACAGAKKRISNKEERAIHISLEEVLKKHLDGCITQIVDQNRLGCVSVEDEIGCFTFIPAEEIQPLISMLKSDIPEKNVCYYKGDFSRFGSEAKYLSDGVGHIYLQSAENGDYKAALEVWLKKKFDGRL